MRPLELMERATIITYSCCCAYGTDTKPFDWLVVPVWRPGLEVIKLEFILRLKIKRNDWLLADTCPQAANHCALF